MKYFDKLRAASLRNASLLCVGLDPDPERLPPCLQGRKNGQLLFNRAIVEATKDSVCAYKLNFAFYEASRLAGLAAIIETLGAIPPEIPVIADAKRGDIGNTAAMYARAVYETLKFDCVTVNPYMGGDTLEPFMAYEEKGLYILCLTSNPGAADFQLPQDLYLRVAERCQEWNTRGNCGLVVGATHPGQMRAIRAAAPGLPFLVPGVGAQGGSVKDVAQGCLMKGPYAPGFLINASRSIIYASGGNDFAEAAAREAEKLRQEIQQAVE
jgi:orotidine-5'-phosphate decarboxylase